MWDGNNDGRGPRYELVAVDEGGVQFKKDPFGCEAPPDGYATRVECQPVKKDGEWQVDWKKDIMGLIPTEPELYFTSRSGHVYGMVRVHMECGGKAGPENRLYIKISCVANPRGERSLNGGRSIPFPVTLPYVEDMPAVNQRKIWAYTDPQKEGWLVVEGEKGAVEPGALVSVVNTRFSGFGQKLREIAWDEKATSAKDGSFVVMLQGEEGDFLRLMIIWKEPKKTG